MLMFAYSCDGYRRIELYSQGQREYVSEMERQKTGKLVCSFIGPPPNLKSMPMGVNDRRNDYSDYSG